MSLVNIIFGKKRVLREIVILLVKIICVQFREIHLFEKLSGLQE